MKTNHSDTQAVPLAQPSDAELIERALRQDTGAMDLLLSEYWERFGSEATRRCADRSAADDVRQEGCVAALARLSDLRNPNRFAAWVLGFIRSRAAHWRRKSRQSAAVEVSLECAAEAADIAAPDPLAWSSEDSAWLRCLLKRRSHRLCGRRSRVAAFMLEAFDLAGDLPTASAVERGVHIPHGSAERDRAAVLVEWLQRVDREGLSPWPRPRPAIPFRPRVPSCSKTLGKPPIIKKVEK